jgi:hypothetical protein
MAQRGDWCPKCKHKTQSLVHVFLRTSPHTILPEEQTPRPNGRDFKLDWLLQSPRGPVAVELDGGQHFKEIKAWGGADALSRNQARDAYKMLYWLSRGARFVRLHQEDTLTGRFDWQTALRCAIDESTDPVVCLEADPDQDSWELLRAEVCAWWGRPVEEWLAANVARLDTLASPDEESMPEAN